MLRQGAALLAAVTMAGCATTPASPKAAPAKADAGSLTMSRAEIGRQDVLTQMTFWAQEVQANPDDIEAARAFVDALRRGGRSARAIEIGKQSLQKFGPDRQLLIGYGLALVSSGRGEEALRPLAIAAQADPLDWRVRMMLGIALDQAGRPEEARAIYREALAIKVDDATLLTNLGVSYLMTGEMADAELILRQAAALPGATPETRMNLSVAIALQGRFDEAERLQRIDLPPQMVSQNMAYLKSLISSPNPWKELGARDDLRGVN